MAKTFKMKPKKGRSKIKSIHIGPVWTVVTLRIRTKLLHRRTKKVLGL